MAPALVGHAGTPVTVDGEALEALLRGTFYKMSGSGNDFVFFDARAAGAPPDVPAHRVTALCARGTGIGADGLVIMDQPSADGVRIAYWNSDGSRAALCGNATLCTAGLAVHLGAARTGTDFTVTTDAGAFRARVTDGTGPMFELAPVQALELDTPDALADTAAGPEQRIGFAVAGVPHVVVRVPDVEAVDLATRSPGLRAPSADRPNGANVNYVSPTTDGRWLMRTFERGVEGETLACGTGAVACAAVLQAWGEARAEVGILTRSGQQLTVILGDPAGRPTLTGEGRLVFVGTLAQRS